MSNFHLSRCLLLLAGKAGCPRLTRSGPSTERCRRLVVHAARSRLGREGNHWHAEADTQNNHRRRPVYSGANAWRPFIPSIDIKAPGHLERRLASHRAWTRSKGIDEDVKKEREVKNENRWGLAERWVSFRRGF